MFELMHSKSVKRKIALIMSFFMIFTAMPVDTVFARDNSSIEEYNYLDLASKSNVEKVTTDSDAMREDSEEDEELKDLSTSSNANIDNIATASDMPSNHVVNSISQSDDDLLRLNMHFKNGNVMKKPDVEIYHTEDEMEENFSLMKILEDSYFDDEVRENIENYYDIEMYHISIHDEKTGEAYKGDANINLKYRYPEDIKDKLDGEFDDIRSSMINTGEVYIDTDVESENMKLRRIMAASDDEKIRLISENLEEIDFLKDEKDSYKEGVLGDNIDENLDDGEIYEELEDREAKFNKKYLEGESTIKNIDEAFNLIVLRRKTIEKPKENNIFLNEEKIASSSNIDKSIVKEFKSDEINLRAEFNPSIFPVDVSLKASIIQEEDEKYSEALSLIKEEGYSTKGLLFDISFYDVDDIEQVNPIEPNGAVKIEISFPENLEKLNIENLEDEANFLHLKNSDSKEKDIEIENLSKEKKADLKIDNEEVKEIKFETDSFSMFFIASNEKIREANAAKINDTEYPSLQEAIDNVRDGEIITFLRDIEESVRCEGGREYTIDMAGHSITPVSQDFDKPCITDKVNKEEYKKTVTPFIIYKNENVSIINGTIKGAEGFQVDYDLIKNYKDQFDYKFNFTRRTDLCSAIYAYGGSYSLDNITIDASSANGNETTLVAKKCWDEDEVMHKMTFTNLKFKNCAGNLIDIGSHDLTLNDTKILNCKTSNKKIINYFSDKNKLIINDLTLDNLTEKGKKDEYPQGLILIKANEAEINNLKIIDNKCDQWILKLDEGTKANFKNTVIKGNKTYHDYGVAGLEIGSECNVTMTDSAVYNNKSLSKYSQYNDFEIAGKSYLKISPVTQFKDSGFDFSNYAAQDCNSGEVVDQIPEKSNSKRCYTINDKDNLSYAAELNGEKIVSLSEALDKACDGDTIKLIKADGKGRPESITASENINVDKNITLDVNGHSIKGEVWFNVTAENVVIKNTDPDADKANYKEPTFEPFIYAKDSGSVELTGDINVANYALIHNSANLKFSGIYRNNIKLYPQDKACAYSLGENVKFKKKVSVFALDVYDLDGFNDKDLQPQDQIIFKGGNDSLISNVVVDYIENSLVTVMFNGENIVLHKINPNGIYIGGKNANDNNDGSTDKNSVKTFDKAKELLKDHPKMDGIYVLDTIEINDDTEWDFKDLPNGKLIRGSNLKKPLVKVKGSLKLSDITIEGLGKDGFDGESPLIEVDGGTLVLSNGAKIVNNRNSKYPQITTSGYERFTDGGAGGILLTDSATLSLEDGAEISGNIGTACGGVAVTNASTFTMNAGTIKNNKATYQQYPDYAAGGGVLVATSSKFKMAGGSIEENSSDWTGGGVGLGGISYFRKQVSKTSLFSLTKDHEDKSGYFEMTGGTIKNNEAESAGGGLYVQHNFQANVSRGEFSGNKANGRFALFSGGGIYVNGSNGDEIDGIPIENGVLYLGNAAIYENSCGKFAKGGGFGGCPSSNTVIYPTNGAAIYGNNRESYGEDDLFIDASMNGVDEKHNGLPDVYIASKMPNGKDNNWMNLNDENEVSGKFEDCNKVITLSPGEDKGYHLVNKTEDKFDIAAVRIYDNSSATNGGGIGSNGDIVIGKPSQLVVKKTVEGRSPEKEKAFSFIVTARKGEETISGEYGEMTFDENGECRFTLKDGETKTADGFEPGVKVSVKEEEYDDWTAVYDIYDQMRWMPGEKSRKTLDDNNEEAKLAAEAEIKENHIVLIHCKNTFVGKMSLGVEKIWLDEDSKVLEEKDIKVDSITVKLLKNGEDSDKSIILSKDNKWKSEFKGLPYYDENDEKIEYLVEEIEVPGFTSYVEETDDGFIIKNIKDKVDEPSNPEPEPEKPVTPSEPDEPVIPSEPDVPSHHGGGGGGGGHRPPVPFPKKNPVSEDPIMPKNEPEVDPVPVDPSNPKEKTSVKTGDESRILMFFSIILMAGFMLMEYMRKKFKED